MALVAILDACVLYPYHLRDFLIRLSIHGELYQARWTEDIHEEWTRNLLKNRPELDRKALQRTVELMNRLPNTLIKKEEYSSSISDIELPDENDRHVLAAAISAGANFIVTFNLKDFPAKSLNEFGVKAISPDDFVAMLAHSSLESIERTLLDQLVSLKNPPMSLSELKEKLASLGLKKSMELLK